MPTWLASPSLTPQSALRQKSVPMGSFTAPSRKRSMRIFGPWRSANIPRWRWLFLPMALTFSARAWCSSGLPWEKLRRTTSTPALISESSASSDSVAGPSVATILVLRLTAITLLSSFPTLPRLVIVYLPEIPGTRRLQWRYRILDQIYHTYLPLPACLHRRQ